MNTNPPGRIGLISNRSSGHNGDHFPTIERLVSECDRVSHIETASTEDIPSALERLAGENVEVLAINGGDGTVSSILGKALESSVFDKLPPVVLLPGGTANMNAGDIGVKGKLLPATRRFCRWAREGERPPGELVQRSLMRVQIGSQAAVHYGMFLGMGAVIQGTEYAHREIHSRGLRDDFSGALGVVRTAWGLFRGDPRFAQAAPVSLLLDEQPEAEEYSALIVAVSSLQRLFMGMRPFWGREPAPLQLTLITEHPRRFPSTFISIVRGRPNRHAVPENGYISHNANRIRIGLQGKLNLDGEIHLCSAEDGGISVTASPPISFLRL